MLVSVWVDLAGANSRFISPAVREPTLTSCSSQQVYFCTSSNITVSIYQKCSKLDTQVLFASSSCHHVIMSHHGRSVASFSHPRAEADSSRDSKQCCTVCCYRGWVTGLSTHLLVSTGIYYLLVDSIYLLLVDII